MSENRKKFAHGDLRGEFVGRIVADPNIKPYQGQNGTSYELVDIRAVCSPYNGKRDPQDLWCTLRFNGGSTPLAKKLRKGCEVIVRGSIRPRTWETKEGQTRLEIDINVSRDWNSLLVTKWSEAANGQGAGASAQTQAQPQPAAAAAAASGGGSQPFDEDDIPF